MKKFLWKRILVGFMAFAMISPTVFAGTNVLVALASEIAETEEQPETPEEEVLPEEDKMSIRDIGVIPDGIVLAGMDADGMTGEEVFRYVSAKLEEKSSAIVKFQLAGEKVEMELAEVGLCWRHEEAAAEALDTAIRGNLIAQYKVGRDIEAGELNTKLEYGVDAATAKQAMQAIVDKFGLEPQNAKAEFNGSGFDITPDVPGVSVDMNLAVAELTDALDGWNGDNFIFDIPGEVVEAEISEEYYDGIGLISEFTTHYYSHASENRNINVELAAKLINGHWFAPGEDISVNGMIGEVSEKTGFALAGAYIDGDTVDKYGGGICQIATTIYNCFLDLELEGITRKNHSKVIDYVPYSMDAAISPQDGLDLIYRNNTGHPLYIQMFTQGEDLTCKFYGVDPRPENRKIVYRSVVLEEHPKPADIDTPDPSMKPGTVVYIRGSYHEVKAQLWKDVYIDGVKVEETRIHTDHYVPLQGIRKYGPAYDDNGTAYYINNDGFAVDEAGKLYRLNPDGTFLDDPLKGQYWDGSAQVNPGGSEDAGESGETTEGTENTENDSTTESGEAAE